MVVHPPWPHHRAGEMAVVAGCEQGPMQKNGLASAERLML